MAEALRIKDAIERWLELQRASQSITAAMCCCQRAGIEGDVLDRLVAIKRDVDRLRRGED